MKPKKNKDLFTMSGEGGKGLPTNYPVHISTRLNRTPFGQLNSSSPCEQCWTPSHFWFTGIHSSLSLQENSCSSHLKIKSTICPRGSDPFHQYNMGHYLLDTVYNLKIRVLYVQEVGTHFIK